MSYEQVTLTISQAKALARWSEAAQGRLEGCSGYGPHFDAAMTVADEVREVLEKDAPTQEARKPGWGHR